MEVQHSHCKSLKSFKVKGLIYVYLKLANLVKLPIFSCHKATIAKVAFNAYFYPPLISEESPPLPHYLFHWKIMSNETKIFERKKKENISELKQNVVVS